MTLQEVQLARSFLFIHAKAFQGAERGGGAAKKKVNAAWGEGEGGKIGGRARADLHISQLTAKKKQDIKNDSVAICHREFHHVTMRNVEKHICSSVI